MSVRPQPVSARLWRRLAALSYDLLLLAGLFLTLAFAVVAARGGRAVEAGTVWFDMLLVATSFVFFGWFWTHGGQTLGMRAWRLRVERADGRPLDWGDATRRYLAAWVAALPLGLGFLWACIDRERLCWHDRLSRTRVKHLQG